MTEVDQHFDRNLLRNYSKCGEILKENDHEHLLYSCSVCQALYDDNILFEQHVYEHFEEKIKISDFQSKTTTIKMKIEDPDEYEYIDSFDELIYADEEDFCEDLEEEETEGVDEGGDYEEEVDRSEGEEGGDDDGMRIDEAFSGKDVNEMKIIEEDLENFKADNEYTLKCNCCASRKFPCFGVLKDHILQIENSETREYDCNLSDCLAKFHSKAELNDHKQVHKMPNIFLCPYCAKMLNSKIELELHCGTKVDDIDLFVSEKLNGSNFKTADKIDDILVKITKETTQRSNDKLQFFICDICSKIFNHLSEIKHHLKRFHGADSITEGRNKLECNVCSKVFRFQKVYVNHMKTHPSVEDGRCYTCQICSETYTHFKRLRQHLDTEHNDMPDNKLEKTGPFQCKLCPKRFVQAKRLVTHTKKQHHVEDDGSDKFHCTVCSKPFRTRENLSQHKRIHTGEKPFECTVCGKRFNHSSYVNIHMRTHTKEKPYKCTECGVGFISKSKLTAHLKGHLNVRPHECSICDRNFRTPATLRDHFRSEHTHEKPFKCNVCGKCFAKLKLLHQHGQLHNEKQFACRFCPQKFSQGAGKHGHERRMHRKEMKTHENVEN